jgi:hypothetical protein
MWVSSSAPRRGAGWAAWWPRRRPALAPSPRRRAMGGEGGGRPGAQAGRGGVVESSKRSARTARSGVPVSCPGGLLRHLGRTLAVLARASLELATVCAVSPTPGWRRADHPPAPRARRPRRHPAAPRRPPRATTGDRGAPAQGGAGSRPRPGQGPCGRWGAEGRRGRQPGAITPAFRAKAHPVRPHGPTTAIANAPAPPRRHNRRRDSHQPARSPAGPRGRSSGPAAGWRRA